MGAPYAQLYNVAAALRRRPLPSGLTTLRDRSTLIGTDRPEHRRRVAAPAQNPRPRRETRNAPPAPARRP